MLRYLRLSQNAEIVLGTVTNLSSAKKWLSGTFLYVRLREHPEHYRIDDDNGESRLEERLERIASRDIDLLCESRFARRNDGDTRLLSTDFGEAMARYCVHFETAKRFLDLPPKAKMSEMVGQHDRCASLYQPLICLSFRRSHKPKNSRKFDFEQTRNRVTKR